MWQERTSQEAVCRKLAVLQAQGVSRFRGRASAFSQFLASSFRDCRIIVVEGRYSLHDCYRPAGEHCPGAHQGRAWMPATTHADIGVTHRSAGRHLSLGTRNCRAQLAATVAGANGAANRFPSFRRPPTHGVRAVPSDTRHSGRGTAVPVLEDCKPKCLRPKRLQVPPGRTCPNLDARVELGSVCFLPLRQCRAANRSGAKSCDWPRPIGGLPDAHEGGGGQGIA